MVVNQGLPAAAFCYQRPAGLSLSLFTSPADKHQHDQESNVQDHGTSHQTTTSEVAAGKIEDTRGEMNKIGERRGLGEEYDGQPVGRRDP